MLKMTMLALAAAVLAVPSAAYYMTTPSNDPLGDTLRGYGFVPINPPSNLMTVGSLYYVDSKVRDFTTICPAEKSDIEEAVVSSRSLEMQESLERKGRFATGVKVDLGWLINGGVDNNYVVNAEICNYCMDCIAPCPTGAIDNWRIVAKPYSLQEQFSWSDLPAQQEIEAGATGGAIEALEDEIGALLEEARKGLGGKAVAPHSASKPTVNLYNRGKPAKATVAGNFRLTHADADSDVRHIILDFGDQPFPVL